MTSIKIEVIICKIFLLAELRLDQRAQNTVSRIDNCVLDVKKKKKKKKKEKREYKGSQKLYETIKLQGRIKQKQLRYSNNQRLQFSSC